MNKVITSLANKYKVSAASLDPKAQKALDRILKKRQGSDT